MDNNINFNNIPINKDVFVKHDADNNTPDNNGKSSKLKIIILGIVIAAIIGVLVVSIIAGSKKGRVDKETVKITSDVKEIEAGWGYQLEVTKNIDKDHHLVYESSNKEVVYINDVGYMTGVNPGEATVTVMVDENKSVKDSIKITVIPENKDKILLSEKNVYIKLGETRRIYVYNIQDNGYVTWESEDKEVATVDDGLIKGINIGETKVNVTNEKGTVQPIKVNVIDNEPVEIELEEITIAEQDIGMDVGEKLQLTVNYDPREATDKTLTWESSNPDAVVVDENGMLTAVGDGNATIIATSSNNLKAMCNTKSTTNIIPVTSIKLDKESIKLYIGDAVTLKYTIAPADATSKNVTWSSSNDDVATVKSGYIIGVKEGTATITVRTSNGKTASAKVTVEKKIIEPTSVALDRTNITMNVDNTATLYGIVRPGNATNKALTWTSSDPAIATVKDGVIKGIKPGTVTITVKTYNGKTATCRVNVTTTVIEVESISLDKTSVTLNIGNTVTLKESFNPSTATNQNVTWKSSDTTIATVSRGTVKAIKTGTATITVRSNNGKTATCTVKVNKVDDTITIRKKTSNYTGGAISASISSRSRSTITATYYSDSKCTIKTNTTNALTVGGAPKESGTYYVIAETAGNANYNPAKSECKEAVTINKKAASITCSNKTYNGNAQTIATCTGGTISNATQTNVGTYDITCKGNDAYADAPTKQCRVLVYNISSKTKIEGIHDVQYTGSPIVQEPTVSVNINGSYKPLVKDTDYTLTINNNKNPGTARIIISGKGNYSGTATATFEILAEPAVITCTDKTYNGSAQVIATCSGGTINNPSKTNAGTYSMSCTPDNNHSRPNNVDCHIYPKDISGATLKNVETQKFNNGYPVTLPNLSVSFGSQQLYSSDYTVSYSNNINVGTATVTITGANNYLGSASATFQIIKNPSIKAKITCSNKPYNGKSQVIASCTNGTVANASQTAVGEYTITCTGNGNYSDADATPCKITKGVDVIKVTMLNEQYETGNQYAALVEATSGQTPEVRYYKNDSSCSNSTASTSIAPSTEGTYYITAKTHATDNYNAGSLSCTKAVIIRKNS